MVCKFSKKLNQNLYFKSLLSAFIKTEFGGLKTMLESASSYGGMRTLNSLLEVLQK